MRGIWALLVPLGLASVKAGPVGSESSVATIYGTTITGTIAYTIPLHGTRDHTAINGSVVGRRSPNGTAPCENFDNNTIVLTPDGHKYPVQCGVVEDDDVPRGNLGASRQPTPAMCAVFCVGSPGCQTFYYVPELPDSNCFLEGFVDDTAANKTVAGGVAPSPTSASAGTTTPSPILSPCANWNLTNNTIISSLNGHKYVIQCGVDRRSPNGNLASTWQPTYDMCAYNCASFSSCQAFSYVQGLFYRNCYLKNFVDYTVADKKVVGGVVLSPTSAIAGTTTPSPSSIAIATVTPTATANATATATKGPPPVGTGTGSFLLTYWQSRKLPPDCKFHWYTAKTTAIDTAAVLCDMGPAKWTTEHSECAIPWPPTHDFPFSGKGPWGTTGCYYNASHELPGPAPGVRAGSMSCNEIQVPCQVSSLAGGVILCNENGGHNPRVICTGFNV